jgi:hypothetical protein
MPNTKPSKMQIWDAYSTTPVDMTKQVSQRGGFTAVCAQSQKKQATQLWGPYGAAWGLRKQVWGFVNGADGSVLELWLEAEFFYPSGAFEISSDITYKAGGECRKKLATDCHSKALSYLGFASDVFEGRFDDSRYVDSLKAGPKPAPAASHAAQRAESHANGAVPVPNGAATRTTPNSDGITERQAVRLMMAGKERADADGVRDGDRYMVLNHSLKAVGLQPLIGEMTWNRILQQLVDGVPSKLINPGIYSDLYDHISEGPGMNEPAVGPPADGAADSEIPF